MNARSIVGAHANAWNASQTGVAGHSVAVDCTFSSFISAFGEVDGATTVQLQIRGLDGTTWYDVPGATGQAVLGGAGAFHLTLQSAGRFFRLTSSADVEATATIAGK